MHWAEASPYPPAPSYKLLWPLAPPFSSPRLVSELSGGGWNQMWPQPPLDGKRIPLFFFPQTGLCKLKTVPVMNTKGYTKEQGTREVVSPSGSHSITVTSSIKILASTCLLTFVLLPLTQDLGRKLL